MSSKISLHLSIGFIRKTFRHWANDGSGSRHQESRIPMAFETYSK